MSEDGQKRSGTRRGRASGKRPRARTHAIRARASRPKVPSSLLGSKLRAAERPAPPKPRKPAAKKKRVAASAARRLVDKHLWPVLARGKGRSKSWGQAALGALAETRARLLAPEIRGFRLPKAPVPLPRPMARRKRRRPLFTRPTIRWQPMLVHAGLGSLLAAAVVTVGVIQYVTSDMPRPEDLAVATAAPRLTVLDHNRDVIVTRGTGTKGFVDVGELPPHVVDAFIAIEDRRFFSHPGVDWLGVARAMVVNMMEGSVVQGGSTITQQLAKNLFLSSERTLKRKAQEVLLASWLEGRYSKDEILGLYLGRVYFGAGAYGLEAAAQRYFQKSADKLSVNEAAMIAGLLKAPSRYSPISNPDGAMARMRVVLDAMEDAGLLDDDQHRVAVAADVGVAASRSGGEAGHFADWVLAAATAAIGEPVQDLTIETTLDLAWQRAAEDAVIAVLAGEGAGKGIGEVALVAIDTTGAVRAMIGGRSYRDSEFNRAVAATRQPGSAFKPFVYVAALDRGRSAHDVMLDAPVRIGTWTPANFSNEYAGEITLASAFARSSNTVAVRLTEEVGRKSVADAAKRLGIDAPLPTHRSLALGTEEVTLVDLTGAYAPFANGGFRAEPFGLVRIRTVSGKPVYETKLPARDKPVVSARTLGQMNAMMAMAVSEGTGRRARLPTGRPQGGKTGTSQDSRDAWFIGYTADLVAGVWVGNDDNSPMADVTGGSVPAAIWRAFVTAIEPGMPVRDLPGSYAAPVRIAQDRDDPAAIGIDRPPSAGAEPDRAFNGFLDGIRRSLDTGSRTRVRESDDPDRYSP